MTDTKNQSFNSKERKDKFMNGEENLASGSREKEVEVIKSKNSEKIDLIKNQLESFQFSEITQTEINNKINKSIDKMKYHWDGGDKFLNIVGATPLLGTVLGPIHSCEISDRAQGAIKGQTREKMPLVVSELVNIAFNDLLEQKNDLVRRLAKLSVKVNNKETELSEKLEKLEKRLEEYDKQDRVLWGKVSKIKDWQRKLSKFLKSELITIVPLEIEMEEIDSLVLVYKQIYREEAKHNSKEKEVKKKEAIVIKSGLRKKIGDRNLEERIFEKCDEIAELRFESEQLLENIPQFEANIEIRPNV